MRVDDRAADIVFLSAGAEEHLGNVRRFPETSPLDSAVTLPEGGQGHDVWDGTNTRNAQLSEIYTTWAVFLQELPVASSIARMRSMWICASWARSAA
jgi:hypothetical protein